MRNYVKKLTEMIREGTVVYVRQNGEITTGKVREAHTQRVTKTIDGQAITRQGEPGNKALYIELEDRSMVLLLETEVSKV